MLLRGPSLFGAPRFHGARAGAATTGDGQGRGLTANAVLEGASSDPGRVRHDAVRFAREKSRWRMPFAKSSVRLRARRSTFEYRSIGAAKYWKSWFRVRSFPRHTDRSDMAVEFESRLDRRQAAAFLTARGYRTAPATLAKLACVGGGPTFESFGRKPLYLEADLLSWAKSKTTGPRRSTSDPGGRPFRGQWLSR
jgi:hypothetical protein